MKTPEPKRHGPAPKLPSVESQTIAFIEESRALSRPCQSRRLRWNGFTVYLRHWKGYPVGVLELREAVVIANVEIPEEYERRGWFWRYCQMCLALTNDALVLEEVQHDGLYAALKKRPEFVEVVPRTFVLRKKRPGDWPLKLVSTASKR